METNVTHPAPVLEVDFLLTAGECDARSEMPVTLMVERIIEVATRHANLLGIGYANLFPRGVGWVLSRLGVEMYRSPRINETYRVRTWIESWNRLFSERCFEFIGSDGLTIGHARTIWATIDFKTRQVADLSGLGTPQMLEHGLKSPMARLRKHGAVTPHISENYTFRFSDLDFNRHVNSVRYVEHILNLWPLSHYDEYRIDRFEIAYIQECLADQRVTINAENREDDSSLVEIVRDGARVLSSAIHFTSQPV